VRPSVGAFLATHAGRSTDILVAASSKDRTLEITAYLPIAVEDLLARLDVPGEAI